MLVLLRTTKSDLTKCVTSNLCIIFYSCVVLCVQLYFITAVLQHSLNVTHHIHCAHKHSKGGVTYITYFVHFGILGLHSSQFCVFSPDDLINKSPAVATK